MEVCYKVANLYFVVALQLKFQPYYAFYDVFYVCLL